MAETQMEDSPLKNLPSPIFHAIRSNGRHVKKYVVEKRLEQAYIDKAYEHFATTSTKPFKLVKRDITYSAIN